MNNKNEKKKTSSRQLALDLYNCKIPEDKNREDFKADLSSIFAAGGFNVIATEIYNIGDDHVAAFIFLNEGHFTVHVYRDLKYVACDFFLCTLAAKPEDVFRAIRKLFKPDKTKTTYLKRGDFGTITDMKPKVKTRFAPLRKLKNTGVKVIGLLRRKVRKH